MTIPDGVTLADITFDELESVDQYEATFTGTVNGEEITVTYALENAIGPEEDKPVFTPGDDELEHVIVQPETYEFETDDRETIRFAATDEDGNDLYLIFVFAEAEDADDNMVSLNVEPAS